MKITSYSFSGTGWNFQKVDFQLFNLIVGDSGAGKTKLFNTIFNLGSCVAQSKLNKGDGHWDLSLEIEGKLINWLIDIETEFDEEFIKSETLMIDGEEIITRNPTEFHFSGNILPKLPNNLLSVSLLKEEKLLSPIYDGFSRMMRRSFFDDVLKANASYVTVNPHLNEKIGRDLFELYKANLPLNPKLLYLRNQFPEIYERIILLFSETFDFIERIEILDSGDFLDLNLPFSVPVFCIREAHVDRWIRLADMSSGMQKVLLILTDMLSLPEGSVYLLDEYENSLGIGALKFFPDLLESGWVNAQVFMTSHHPYIIQNIPVKHWYVTHRKGGNVQFDYGDSLVKRYSISSQEKYFQLINDPNYYEGIE